MMRTRNKDRKKKKNENKDAKVITTTTVASLLKSGFFVLVIIVATATSSVITPLASLQLQSAEGFINPNINPVDELAARAPVVVSGNNIYVAWWTNNTANKNEEVLFRASNDGGQTFSDKINLSNTNDADSWRVEIAGEGADVIVTWWETNQTGDTPVARTSTDGGHTFGPMLRIANSGGISNTE